MKLTIAGYKVNISVADEYASRASKEITMAFLNTVSLYVREAENSYLERGMDSLSEHAGLISNDIYNTLKKAGLYER